MADRTFIDSEVGRKFLMRDRNDAMMPCRARAHDRTRGAGWAISLLPGVCV